MSILLAGGAGYIGSHTAVAMIDAGFDVIIVDNLYNSNAAVNDRIEEITGARPKFYECDIRDKASTDGIFAENEIETVIHFAGLKAVGESVGKPLQYYRCGGGYEHTHQREIKRTEEIRSDLVGGSNNGK